MMMVPGAPSASSTNSGKRPSRSASGVAAGRFSGHASAPSAKAPAPSRLCSSQVVSSTVMSGRGVPDSSTECNPSKMAAMPALSSAERIVSPVEGDRESHFSQLLRAIGCHGSLVPRRALDGHHFQKRFKHTIGVHKVPSFFSLQQRGDQGRPLRISGQANERLR